MILKVIVCTILVPFVFGIPLQPSKRLTLATWDSHFEQDHKGPGTYAFSYDIEDPLSGNVQFKQEERHINGTITGEFGYVDEEGVPTTVMYTADTAGFRCLRFGGGKRMHECGGGQGKVSILGYCDHGLTSLEGSLSKVKIERRGSPTQYFP